MRPRSDHSRVMAAIPPGAFAFVCYDGAELYHERIVAAWAWGSEAHYVVVSPDHDLFLEQLDGNNSDLSGLRFGDESGSLPAGLARREIHTFQPRPSGASLAGLFREGALFAATARPFRRVGRGADVRNGTRSAGCARGPPRPAPDGAASAEAAPGHLVRPRGAWVPNEPVKGHALGSEVAFPPAALDFGGRSIVRVAGDVAGRAWATDGPWAGLPGGAEGPGDAERQHAGYRGSYERWLWRSPRLLGSREQDRALALVATRTPAHLQDARVRRLERLLESEAEHGARVSESPPTEAHREDEGILGVAMSGALKAHIAARGREAAILKERRKAREARDHCPSGGSWLWRRRGRGCQRAQEG